MCISTPSFSRADAHACGAMKSTTQENEKSEAVEGLKVSLHKQQKLAESLVVQLFS